MSVLINHFRGNRKDFDQSKHGEGIYFATDTNEIILNGEAFGKSNLVEYKLEDVNLTLVDAYSAAEESATLTFKVDSKYSETEKGVADVLHPNDILEVQNIKGYTTNGTQSSDNLLLVVDEYPTMQSSRIAIKVKAINGMQQHLGKNIIPSLAANAVAVLKKSFMLPEIKYTILKEFTTTRNYSMPLPDFVSSSDARVRFYLDNASNEYLKNNAKVGDFIIFPEIYGGYEAVQYVNMPLVMYIVANNAETITMSAVNGVTVGGIKRITPYIKSGSKFYHVSNLSFELPDMVVTNKMLWGTNGGNYYTPGTFDFLAEIMNLRSKVDALEKAASW